MVQVESNSCEGRSFGHRLGRRLGRRLVSYAVVCSFLAFVNWMTDPHYWWVLWVVAGWGVQILIDAICFVLGWDEEK